MRNRVLAALRQPSLKVTLIAIVLVVVLPTLAVVAATLYSASRSLHDAGTRQLLETARTVARSSWSELTMAGNMVRNWVVHAPAPAAGQTVGFAQGRLSLHRAQQSAQGWVLEQPSSVSDTEAALLRQAAQTGQVQVSDLVADPLNAETPLRLQLAVPVAHTENRWQLALWSTPPQHLLQALSQHGDGSRSVILAITDSQGRILERSVDRERFVGQRVPDWDTVQAQPGDSGSFTAQTLEGRSIVFAFQRIAGTPGWVAVVGEAAQSFNQRSQGPIWVMLAASAVTVGAALLLALWLVRTTLQPIQLLAQRARRIAHDPQRGVQPLMADVPPSFVAEFEVLRQSLDQADQVVQTALQESRAAAQEAHEHLSVLQAAEQQARLGHWSMDLASGQLRCSEMLSVLYGDPYEAIVIPGMELKRRLEASSFERLQAAVRLCREKGTPYAMEVEHLRRDGSSFPAYLRGAPVYGAGGELVAIAGTLQDISDSKEQALRLEALADNLPSGVIFRCERDDQRRLRLQLVSAGLEQATGLSAKGLLRDAGPLLRAMASSDLRRLLRSMQRAERAGDVVEATFALRTPQCAPLWIHCRAALRFPSQGGAVWDGIAQDVTVERAAEAALRASKEAAEAAERAKSDFLATMSHEIRTPMNSVIGMARLALRTALDAKQRNYLEKINDSANVLLGIINDILDFSKMEAGGMVLEGVPVRLESVLETVASVTALKAEEKGLEITFAMDPQVPEWVRGDALRLGQVLTNLVSNAVKFTHEGDVLVRVEVRAGEGHDLLHFAVTDTGIGLSEAQQAGLFRPFSQAQTDTTRRYGGTGLGLAISKRLVEMMGGQIGVRSQLGAGSCFDFALPLEACAPPHAVLSTSGRSPVLHGQRILIADDNPIARTALAEMAQGFGMHTTLASNGHEAVQLLLEQLQRGEPFDLVVLDWRMPVMDGVEAARWIKTHAPLDQLPAVLMVTAYSQDAMLHASQGVDLQGVLLKPVTQSAMFNTLLKAVSGDGEALPSASAAAYAPSDLQAYTGLRGKRVLVADDNALNREVATDLLACVGVHVVTAVDGMDALRCLQTQEVDAVLMDIHMPLMDGLEATREIRRHLRWLQLPILALTAQARTEDVALSREAGMNGHLTKPIDEVALYSALLAHCAGAPSTMSPDAALPEANVGEAWQEGDAPSTVGATPFARLSSSPARRAQLLKGFLQDFAQLPERLIEQAAQGQWQALADSVHQIKGSAGYLDQVALCRVADEVENAARSGASEPVRARLPELLRLVEGCLQQVAQALAQTSQPEPSSAAALGDDAVKLVALIERIRPLVRHGNFAAHALLAQLVQAADGQPWASKAEAALDAFDDLENEQCLLLLSAVEAALSPSSRPAGGDAGA